LFGFRATLFSEGFVKTIVDWLEPYGVPLTGHLDQEEVVNPTGVSGDAIKFFEYQEIPGLDQIFQYGRGSCMYKLISSAAVNYDRHLVMTETYGATKNMPPANLYKEVMDQAVKGINMFVPHAVWYDSQGEKTMPPDLSPRDPKYGPELSRYNEYVGRIHLLLQKPGRTVADIAILYPIESLQATYHFHGPLDAYVGGVPSDRDNYMKIGEFLSFQLRRDFHYLHPEVLRDKCSFEASATLTLPNEINPNFYSTLVIPTMEVIELETLRKIHDFHKIGGKVICVGELPKNTVEPGEKARLTLLLFLQEIFGPEDNRNTHFINVDPTQPLEQVEQQFSLVLDATRADVQFSPEESLPKSSPTGSFMYLHRVLDGRDVYFFSNSTEQSVDTMVSLRGIKNKRFEFWNPHDGTIRKVESVQFNEGRTVIPLKLGPVDSLFLIAVGE
ncbi:MAG: hypothetical protein FWC43_02490, partial [Planctomycetaceae bacterium]|nr:hypothetical protein [Planctomycetaceae bacterium]